MLSIIKVHIHKILVQFENKGQQEKPLLPIIYKLYKQQSTLHADEVCFGVGSYYNSSAPSMKK